MALSNRETVQELRALQSLGGKQPNALNFIMNMQALMIILAGWTSISAELFLRINFGERYFNFLRVLIGYLTFRFFTGIIWFFTALPFIFPRPGGIQRPASLNFLLLFTLAYWGWAAVQLLWIGYRNREGIVWHSESFGRSILSFMLPWLMPISRLVFGKGNPEFILYRAVEPSIAFIFGWLFTSVDRVIGIWFMFAAVALFIRNNLVFNAQRSRVLDRQDAQIEAQAYQMMQEQMKERGGNLRYKDMNVAGYSVIPMQAVDIQAELAERKIVPTVEEVVAETMGRSPDREDGDGEPTDGTVRAQE